MPSIRLSTVSLKFWIGLSIVLMTVCILLVLTLLNMAPQVKVIPQMFSPDSMTFPQLIEATNINALNAQERRLIDEMMVRFYIENRHFYIPDRAELDYRYGPRGPVGRLSAPAIYNKFIAGKGNYAENIANDDGARTVDILNVTRRDNTFTVDFRLYSYNKGKVIPGGTRRATVKIGYNRAFRNFARDFANPFGLYVVSYDETGYSGVETKK